ncbi:GNAT family N-acetyltransferase [Lysobacter sp. A3-1-A15]|uniref:GNAT family N-acetyltransferase n=1 Tax=Novilysobacter viscosus TaxID=3098602 RepID=UPI002ED77B16
MPDGLAATRLETERLVLRVPRIEDFERYADMFAREELRSIGGPLVRGEAWRRFLQMPGAWMLQGFAMFSLVEKDTGRWIGLAGPWHPDGWPGTEVGYSLHPDAWGMGYATEACEAAMDFAFDQLGWDEVVHTIARDNAGSQSVARRLGARNRGPVTLPPPLDAIEADLWGQSRAEWRSRRVRHTVA